MADSSDRGRFPGPATGGVDATTENMTMRKAWLIVAGALSLAAATSPVHPAQALDAGTYSDGYRMGIITKWSLRGSLVLKTGEGEMQLGNDASPPAVFTDKDGIPFLF